MTKKEPPKTRSSQRIHRGPMSGHARQTFLKAGIKIGTPAGFKSESPAGSRRNSQL
jgi:hypothetical protein